MKEKTLKKIRKLLAKEGVEEEKIDSIVDEIESTEESDEDSPIDEEETEEVVNPIPPEEVSEIPPEVTPVDEEGLSQGEPTPTLVPPSIPPEGDLEQQPPVDAIPGSIEDALGQLGANGEVPPESQPTPTPTVDPQIQDLLTEIEELKKANEGLLARVSSLEEALKSAGVIEGGLSFGDERPSLPTSEETQANDQLASILRQINGKF